MLFGLVWAGCRGEASSCPPGNGVACDIFSFPVKLRQESPRLHFTDSQVVAGACEPPACATADCTALVFPGLFYQLEVTDAPGEVSPPDTRCRFRIASVEGEALDVELALAGTSPFSACCNTGPRKFVSYSWSAFVNGIALVPNLGGYDLPLALDGGIASNDGGTP
jgi:hypothetical protein